MIDAQKGEVQQPGQGEQLPQGAATELNAGAMTPAVDPQSQAPQAGAPMVEEEVPIQTASARDFRPTYQPQDEDEEMMFSPTTRPTEPLLTGLRDGYAPIPNYLKRQLPALVEIAEQPDAPPQIQFLVNYLLRRIQQSKQNVRSTGTPQEARDWAIAMRREAMTRGASDRQHKLVRQAFESTLETEGRAAAVEQRQELRSGVREADKKARLGRESGADEPPVNDNA